VIEVQQHRDPSQKIAIIGKNLLFFFFFRKPFGLTPPHRAKESDRAEGGGITKNFWNIEVTLLHFVTLM